MSKFEVKTASGEKKEGEKPKEGILSKKRDFWRDSR
jgi:hypothetical protein